MVGGVALLLSPDFCGSAHTSLRVGPLHPLVRRCTCSPALTASERPFEVMPSRIEQFGSNPTTNSGRLRRSGRGDLDRCTPALMPFPANAAGWSISLGYFNRRRYSAPVRDAADLTTAPASAELPPPKLGTPSCWTGTLYWPD